MSDRYVAFMDLLGFKDEIRDAEKSANWVKVETALEIIRTTLCNIPMVDMRFTYFSDCLYISSNASEIGLICLLQSIEELTLNLLYEDVFVRGGLTRGSVCHSDHHIYGTAVIKAYEMECLDAKNARTIVCPQVVKDVINLNRLHQDVLRQDVDDGQYFVHFLRGFANYMTNPPQAGDQLMEDPAARVMDCVIHRLLKHAGSPLEKAQWMASYWNSAVAYKGIFGEISSRVEPTNASKGAPRSFIRIAGK